MKGIKDTKGRFVKNIPSVKNCLLCNSEFNPRLNAQKFCSHECSAQDKKVDKSRNCVVCKRIFSVKATATRFCSQACYTVHGRVPKGEKSHFWKGGITPINNVIRSSGKYKNMVKEVFARDEYTCCKCGISGVTINMHHVIPFSDMMNYLKHKFGLDNVVEQAMKDECFLWDENNCMTLCVECHKQTDSYLNNKNGI